MVLDPKSKHLFEDIHSNENAVLKGLKENDSRNVSTLKVTTCTNIYRMQWREAHWHTGRNTAELQVWVTTMFQCCYPLSKTTLSIPVTMRQETHVSAW
jgi:hypothetical protein